MKDVNQSKSQVDQSIFFLTFNHSKNEIMETSSLAVSDKQSQAPKKEKDLFLDHSLSQLVGSEPRSVGETHSSNLLCKLQNRLQNTASKVPSGSGAKSSFAMSRSTPTMMNRY